jgi:hypothetical protein
MVVIVSSASGFAAVFCDSEKRSQSGLEIDDILNDYERHDDGCDCEGRDFEGHDFDGLDFEGLGFRRHCWQSWAIPETRNGRAP